MSECQHDLAERETACADGMCPLCAAARIRELEADVALLRANWMKGEWIKAERDAIRAQTIEECAQLAACWEHPNWKRNAKSPEWLAGHDAACLGIDKAIRALAKPVAAEKEQT